MESESDSKLDTKRSLVIFVPTSEKEEENGECKGQKTKRCKTLFHGERVGAPIPRGTLRATLKSIGDPCNNERRHEYFVGRKPSMHLLSLKKPMTIEEAKNATFRDEALFDSLRKQLLRYNFNVGATRKTGTEPRINVYNDDNFVCYCREKNNPSSRKDTNRDIISKLRALARKDKWGNKPDRKDALVGKKQDPQPSQTKIPSLSNRFPETYYLPNEMNPVQSPTSNRFPHIYYLPNNADPMIPRKHGAILYAPTIHRVDPPLLVPKNTVEQAMRNDIPFDPIGLESVVGQRAPINRQHDLNKNQQTVEQTDDPSSMVGNSLSRSENIIPATVKFSTSEDTSKNKLEEEETNDSNNLQSVPSESFDKNHLPPPETVGSPPVAPADVHTIDPNSNHGSSTGLGNEYGNEYEITGSGTLDYSDIKEVTAAYFTSRAYSNESENDGSTGYDNLLINNTGSMSDDTKYDNDYNLDSRVNNSVEKALGSENVDMKMDGHNSKNSDRGDEEKDIVGENNPDWDSNQDPEDNMENQQRKNLDYEIPSSVEEKIALVPENTMSLDKAGTVKLNDKEKEESKGRDPDDIPLRNENNPSSFESTLKSVKTDDFSKEPSDETLPFCDNTMLHKSIKTVINNFAAGDSSEMDGNEETVGSAKGEDLLPEIVQVPNLKSILSMPPIEHTILDEIKNLLSKMTGMNRKKFNSDWATNVIRNNLRNTISAAPSSKTELPPLAVEEHQFKNGKWVTNMVTLAPSNEKTDDSTDMKRLQASIKSFLRDPVIGLQTGKNPAVQNIIVQSIKNTLKPEDPINDVFNDSIIRSSLNDELNIMEMENEEISTTENTFKSTTFSLSNIDMKKFLEIAKNEADLNNDETTQPSTYENIPDRKNDISSIVKSLDNGIIGAKRNFKSTEDTTIATKTYSNEETIRDIVEFSELPYNSMTEIWPNNNVSSGIEDKSSTKRIEHHNVGYSSPKMNPTENVDIVNRYKDESIEKSMENESSDTIPAQDFTYLGKITVKNEGNKNDVQSLRNSELFYIGDGVKLPLEIKKLNDDSYALSISRKVCEQLLNKECPCCVPTKGNIVRTVKRNSSAINTDRTIKAKQKIKISKRESMKSILSNEKYNLIDDSLQIFSMPVEAFAKRYNLSLNLEKVQTPWNFDLKKNIDEQLRDRLKNFKNKEEKNADADFHKLLTIRISENNKPETTIIKEERIDNHPDEKNDVTSYKYHIENRRNLEKYRHQRNIEKSTNKRMEIATKVLNWIRDLILNKNTG